MVTGAGSGIGKSAAIILARPGSSVVLVGPTPANLEVARREIQ
jgi:NAD(P)-dependent dehydrogenase (short-subunit alcohol dehydrogenase family)